MLIDAKTLVSFGTGVIATLAGKKAYDKYRAVEEDSGFDYDEAIEAVYLKKGPKGLAKWLKAEGYAEDRDDALEMVSDFEDENEDAVEKYEKRQARKDRVLAKREERDAARKAARGSRATA